MTSRILLTGKNGQVGSELLPLLQSCSDLAAVGRSELDLVKPAEIRRVIAQARPHLIINAAAYTGVDQAEKEESLARAVNADAPAVMAEEAKKIGALVVHYSTDYVFDGTKHSPYTEDDAPNPLNAYGRTKLAGEEAIRASGAAHLILRTAWVYATHGKNFLLTILRLATAREELRVVHDQFGAPTPARAIAQATVRILSIVARSAETRLGRRSFSSDMRAGASSGFSTPGARSAHLASLEDRTGTYHLTAAGETSWHEFAVAIVDECSRIRHGEPTSPAAQWLRTATAGRPIIAKRVAPITTQDYPLPARRPPYSVLSNTRLATAFGFSLPDWRSQLSEVCRSGL